MIVPEVLLDTDTVSYLMRADPKVTSRAGSYRQARSQFQISAITQYEILKGLKARGASTRLRFFERFCEQHVVLPLTEEIIRRAADIYANLHRRGALIGDADILIGATALVHGLVVITNNEAHFRRITGLQIDNWLT